MNPRSGIQLEILSDSAGELDAFRRIVRIDETAGIADLVEALVIECLRGKVGAFPVAGRHVRSADAQLVFAGLVGGNQLELGAGCGKAKRTTSRRVGW